ncbi:Bax inhibitor-1/YccA family protein [Mumia sp. zg.B17]|uniref:Bax inhibitor-1/YccA family protein n=1 Tax=unclassified Mumia TaxID=2621872 RepID=UPI001C6F5C81|nr:MULTISPECIES: Bax inhibitor-1/YccA family protein [unclassified Mumia]MBW9207924.1 Bax inhibitor-1/YccA family protein [Mumia sp. zg.B17]MBW9210810.1 Bax inhibitor-1/YccA family protein [Mumia sp. zg.B21]MDD9349990.1 Bax inhibitor-1/YccA family protein [Mumia sp.]
MKSNNPVFARSDEFNGRAARPGTAPTGYTDPSTWQIGQSDGYDGGSGQGPHSTAVADRMTIDSVVQKTALTIGLTALSAAVVWFMIGDISADQSKLATAFALATGGAIIGFVLAMVNSFKKVISPPLVLAYAVVEGVFVGALSKVVSSYVGDPGIVAQAVLGTIAAFAGTLFVYRFFNIKVTDKFRRGVTAALFGFMAVILLNFVLSFFGADFGIRDFSMLGLIVSCIAVVLGVLCLILDFDFVENGIKAGLPERESWRAAFGLTVTLIWLYIEILRILAILRGDN